MHLSRLRLSGFKSFVEGCELAVAPGMTGIVGPNGCGKSNLVEALRWVMGENSPRRMRGGEMDDVIFNGTSARPARNVAEVALLLDNAAFDAPNPFNDATEIEVLRRIERQGGSTYRINGREVRARDVQLLFADAASGSKSASLVGQGRVAELINSKPNQRRHLLEEAAGIAGLQSRRHEAELRLRAAETNLARVADIMGQLQTQLDGLKRQARQAGRYRRLSERIRETEARLLEMRFRAAEVAWAEAARRFEAAEREVGRLTLDAARAQRERDEAAEALEPARHVEAAAGAELHRLEVARVALDAEEARLRDLERELADRLAQARADLDRETALVADAEASLSRIGAEIEALEAERAGAEDGDRAAVAAKDQAAAEVVERETELASLSAERFAREERRAALEREIADLDRRAAELDRRVGELTGELDRVTAAAAAEGALDEARWAEAACAMAVADAGVSAESRARLRSAAAAAEQAANEALRGAEASLARLETEAAALAHVLASGRSADLPPILDSVAVTPGYELALGAALGDDLDASTAPDAPARWRELPPLEGAPLLPYGVAPLARFVEAPPALARRLGQIGVIDGAPDDGRVAALAVGQRLVSRDGGLWRWDGFSSRPGAVTGAATRLRQRGRLNEIAPSLAAARAERDRLARAAEAAKAAATTAATSDAEARAALQAAEDATSRARSTLARREAEAASLATRRAALSEHRDRVVAERETASNRLEAARASAAALPPPGEGDERLTAVRAVRDESRSLLARRMAAFALIVETARAREARIGALADERDSWSRRAAGARERADALALRKSATEAEIERLADLPASIASRRRTMIEAIDRAQARRDAAADARAAAETRLRATDQASRGAERALAEAREERVRAEGLGEQARVTRDELTATIAERLGVAPDQLRGIVAEAETDGTAAEAEATVQDLTATLQRVTRERDAIGPVNLRAEIEAEEVERQLGAMTTERADLDDAITRLRRGIAELNREGRDRLIAAFEVIDGHFRALFARLFGGGQARLELIDAEDPLEAGLEIVASPPGKKLQTLSLLSGGEQALTALALIFAQFETNPSPICVLDEVDAPLDDANVDRFCALLDHIAHQGVTRFLVITHHPLTMARMDRLFGVTMAERGVSQLVSVDLVQAERLRATA